ncbi:MAG: hypothetical protein P8R54_26040 [Myxococcota bacterium]|nr:hypothetical protein [Myxococcota bacterium]
MNLRLPIHAAAFMLISGCNGCKSDVNVASTFEDTGEPFLSDWGSWLSMDVMPDGSPAIAYYDATDGGLGFAIASIEDDGSVSWSREQVDGYLNADNLDTGDRGKYASMKIAADGTVWIAYQDVALGTLRYAVRGDGGWTSDIADIGGGSSSDAGYFASMALDADGMPVIVHYDNKQSNLRIARWIGSGFTAEVLVEGEDYVPTDTGSVGMDAQVGEFAKIVISGGIEYVAYYDRAFGDLKMSWGTSGSHSVEVIDTEGDVGQWPDLLIDGGTIHIAYHDITNQDLKYASGAPGSWSSAIVDSGDYVGADTDIFLDPASNGVSFAYFDGRNNDMKLAWQSGGEWNLDTVVGSEGALGFHNEVVTSGGVTYAACYDYTNRKLWFSVL